MPARDPLKREIILEYMQKWPDLPNRTLAKLIYSRDDNYKVFNSAESVRTLIRYYRGANGDKLRRELSTKEHLK